MSGDSVVDKTMAIIYKAVHDGKRASERCKCGRPYYTHGMLLDILDEEYPDITAEERKSIVTFLGHQDLISDHDFLLLVCAHCGEPIGESFLTELCDYDRDYYCVRHCPEHVWNWDYDVPLQCQHCGLNFEDYLLLMLIQNGIKFDRCIAGDEGHMVDDDLDVPIAVDAQLRLDWDDQTRSRRFKLRFTGDIDRFEAWRRKWFRLVPRCDDFDCVHDSMTCGIGHACGDCSKYETMYNDGCMDICTSVGCADCLRKHECEFGKLTDAEIMARTDLRFKQREDKNVPT